MIDIFSKELQLENEWVILRPLQLTDLDYFLPFVKNEPDLWKYSLVSPAGEEKMKTYIETALQNKASKKEYPFIVFDKLHNEYAGCTRFYDIQIPFQTTQLGYTWYGKKFQQTGLNRHCKLLLLQFAFEEWDMLRVEFRADANNEKSVKAMKSIGCIEEGILRSHIPADNGARRNSIILSILKDEWLNHVKSALINKTW
jgi:RimJ/RimL family protein N-acetyltransferase